MVVWLGWIIALVTAPIGIFIRGICISFTWGWFIAPVTGWRQITVVEAVGISIFFSFLSGQIKYEKPNYDEMNTKEIAIHVASATFGYSILGPLISLLYAWIWQTVFMPSSN